MKVFLVGIALFAAAGAAPEDRPSDEVLLKSQVEHGGFGGPEMRISTSPD